MKNNKNCIKVLVRKAEGKLGEEKVQREGCAF